MTGNPVISFWLRSYYSDAEIQIISYSGDFTETDPSNYIELIATIKPDTLDTWEYKHVSLPEGTYRIGIVKDTNSGGSVIDNMFLGSDTYPNGNQPGSYNIYRNGVLLNNIPVSGLYEQYEDDNFTENDNEYFIRAVYPTGLSLKSASTTAYIDVNPVPHYLTGIYNNTNDKVDLSWYYPGHYPPHWFGFKYDTDTPSFFLWGQGDSVWIIWTDVGKAQWIYNAETGKYQNWTIDESTDYTYQPLIDQNTGEQLSFSNVIVLKAPYTEIKTTLHDIDLLGNETGYEATIFRDGLAYEVFWKTPQSDKPIQFFDSEGNPFHLQPGNTWIAIFGLTSPTVVENGDWSITFNMP